MWFILGKSRIDVSRVTAPRLILGALAQMHDLDSSLSLTVSQMGQIAWKDERVIPRALANRIYQAIAKLRKMGLGQGIYKSRMGYRIAVSVQVKIYDQPSLQQLLDNHQFHLYIERLIHHSEWAIQLEHKAALSKIISHLARAEHHLTSAHLEQVVPIRAFFATLAQDTNLN